MTSLKLSFSIIPSCVTYRKQLYSRAILLFSALYPILIDAVFIVDNESIFKINRKQILSLHLTLAMTSLIL